MRTLARKYGLMHPTTTRLLRAINVGLVSPLKVGDRTVQSAIVKTPVSTLANPVRIDVGVLGLAGDEQADPTVHGGLNKAVYAYPHEHYPFWETVRAQAGAQPWGAPLPVGMPGENLTLQGLLESGAFKIGRAHV